MLTTDDIFMSLDVVVQFYPWFKFYFPLFFYSLSYITISKKQRKIKFEPRIKLNHNIDIAGFYPGFEIQVDIPENYPQIFKTKNAFIRCSFCDLN